jgi:hypothetical protein
MNTATTTPEMKVRAAIELIAAVERDTDGPAVLFHFRPGRRKGESAQPHEVTEIFKNFGRSGGI